MPAVARFGVALLGGKGIVEDFQVLEELAATRGRQGAEDLLHAGLVARGDFFPERAALGGQDEDDLAAVLGMLLALDEAVADHAIEHDGDARFADEQELNQCGLIHAAIAGGQQVEDVELRPGQAERLEEGFAAAFEEIMHEKVGDEEIVGFKLAFHGDIITVNSMMSNYIAFEYSFRIYPIRGYAGVFHLLYDAIRREAVLIDTGLIGELPRLEKILSEIDLTWRGIKAIMLTHGHLDHTGNLARLKELTGAPLLAHPLEQAHIDGTFPYAGPSRVCGFMESVGRGVFRYRPIPIDEPLVPATELPHWGGLRVVYLPGHTEGHCGFYCARFNLLFSGDLFASYWFSTHLPPPFLNSCPEKFDASLRQVRQLAPRYIIPNHYDRLDGELHRKRFEALLR
jgi:glyoxylase-like metal-dependent hydrolase (beta-lactamase superfamily II)